MVVGQIVNMELDYLTYYTDTRTGDAHVGLLPDAEHVTSDDEIFPEDRLPDPNEPDDEIHTEPTESETMDTTSKSNHTKTSNTAPKALARAAQPESEHKDDITEKGKSLINDGNDSLIEEHKEDNFKSSDKNNEKGVTGNEKSSTIVEKEKTEMPLEMKGLGFWKTNSFFYDPPEKFFKDNRIKSKGENSETPPVFTCREPKVTITHDLIDVLLPTSFGTNIFRKNVWKKKKEAKLTVVGEVSDAETEISVDADFEKEAAERLSHHNTVITNLVQGLTFNNSDFLDRLAQRAASFDRAQKMAAKKAELVARELQAAKERTLKEQIAARHERARREALYIEQKNNEALKRREADQLAKFERTEEARQTAIKMWEAAQQKSESSANMVTSTKLGADAKARRPTTSMRYIKLAKFNDASNNSVKSSTASNSHQSYPNILIRKDPNNPFRTNSSLKSVLNNPPAKTIDPNKKLDAGVPSTAEMAHLKQQLDRRLFANRALKNIYIAPKLPPLVHQGNISELQLTNGQKLQGLITNSLSEQPETNPTIQQKPNRPTNSQAQPYKPNDKTVVPGSPTLSALCTQLSSNALKKPSIPTTVHEVSTGRRLLPSNALRQPFVPTAVHQVSTGRRILPKFADKTSEKIETEQKVGMVVVRVKLDSDQVKIVEDTIKSCRVKIKRLNPITVAAAHKGPVMVGDQRHRRRRDTYMALALNSSTNQSNSHPEIKKYLQQNNSKPPAVALPAVQQSHTAKSLRQQPPRAATTPNKRNKSNLFQIAEPPAKKRALKGAFLPPCPPPDELLIEPVRHDRVKEDKQFVPLKTQAQTFPQLTKTTASASVPKLSLITLEDDDQTDSGKGSSNNSSSSKNLTEDSSDDDVIVL